MMKLVDMVIHRYHSIIMTEDDVMRAIMYLNLFKIYDMTVANCGWEEKDKWFIHFVTSDYKWKEIVKTMQIIRVWTYFDIPIDTKGRVYSDN